MKRATTERPDGVSGSRSARVEHCRVLLALGMLCACERAREAPEHGIQAATLTSGVVARVADDALLAATVQRVARANALPARAALERAVSDSLFANEARRQLPESTLRTIERAAIARALLEELAREAEQRGAVTDEEVRLISEERWVDFDRPRSARVTHAVVMRPKDASSALARQLADKIAKAVEGIADPERFMTVARALPRGTLEVKAERLPYMTEDGRSLSLEGGAHALPSEFDAHFAAQANRLKNPGEHSGIIETSYGYHVLLLEALLPALRISLEDRRVGLRAEVLSRRAGSLQRELTSRLSAARTPQVSRDADALSAGLGEAR